MNKVCKKVRILLLISVVMYSVGIWGAGFTPTDGGLVVNLKQGDRILLSVMIDDDNNPATPDVEYFVCHYPGYTGGHFNYNNYNWDDKGSGNILKLIPQDAGATEPATPSIWSIDDPKPFKSGGTTYTFDGIGYTMWSSNPGGDPYTLVCSPSSTFKYQGYLTKEKDHANICNAIFVAPTDRGDKVETFDPNNTMGRGTKFNGEKGYGFLGMPYREVYWLDIPRGNSNPMAYTNASVVSFNTTTSDYKYSENKETAKPGQAMYAFADNKHKPTKRTIFRLYVLDEPVTSTCADSYFFAYDEQDSVRYYAWDKNNYTSWRKIYTIDRLVCMEHLGETEYYVSDYMNVPESDNTYYYVGYQNKYCHTDRGDAFNSQFKNIRELPIQHLTGFTAPVGAYGRMVVEDATSTADNLDVKFRPAGVFLRTNSGRNIRMQPNADSTVWTCDEMWTITDAYTKLEIKATLFSGPDFSETDPGVDIDGWSELVAGTSVPLSDGTRNVRGGDVGWARIYINRTEKNGNLEFVPANPDCHIHYDNNGFVGSQIPDQYPEQGSNSVKIEEDRLVGGFAFEGWTTNRDGTGTLYHKGDVVNLEAGELTLYAKATYTGTIHVALSFMHSDGKRYFMTHPGAVAPRYSRARHIDDWTDAWQGMENAENNDPRYINTFKLENDSDVEAEGEFVLDPRRELRYGAKDSLLFYEYFEPTKEEYLGLYYTDPNTVIANTTWAGLFTSTNGWPDYSVADVQNTKLKSTHYLHRVEGVLKRDERSNSDKPFVKYNAAANQFDGTADMAEATTFQISRVRVADEHYVVIPDTTEEWQNEITFGYHTDEQTEQQVWSKLIGKQLMAVTKLGDDTVYFHPNRDKVLTTSSALRLSADYRLSQTFTYIRDSRVESLGSAVAESNKPHMSELSNEFGRVIASGLNSPLDVAYGGNYIDIEDTLRITLRPTGTGKIKAYYGRWKNGAPGLHIHADGTRHRDIIIRTKTYHYGETITHLVLIPEKKTYNFSPLDGDEKTLTFTLSKVTSRQLLDVDGNVMAEEIIDSEDVTSQLSLGPGSCSFARGGTFDIINEETLDDHVTLATHSDNTSAVRYDTLVITSNATVGGVNYPVTGRVPLTQAMLSGDELIWSVEANGTRYYIMAGSGGLIFRQFEKKGSTLYKKEDGRTKLIKGAANPANDQTQYITPWRYDYVSQANKQLTLKTEQEINKYFVINGSSLGDVADSGPSTLTYKYVHEYINDNANYEEQVKLKYGSEGWLKFEISGSTPRLALTANENEASVFSWSYLLQEYNLLNNGTYPSLERAEFGYNSSLTVNITTRYSAYREYSMLVGNEVVYCCKEEENNIPNLTNKDKDWKTNYTITHIPDARAFDGGTKSSGLSISTNTGNLVTTISQDPTSPTNVTIGGKYVNIVDTLDVVLSLQPGAPAYRFKGAWSGFTSIEDAHLKIPLVRKTYYTAPFDSMVCVVDNDEYNYVFPATIGEDDSTHVFVLHTKHRRGTHTKNVENNTVSHTYEEHDHTGDMKLNEAAYAEVRLIDEYGNTPQWCHISGKSSNTITVKCTENGIRAPRSAYVYIVYIMQDDSKKWHYINFRLTVGQSSRFQYANNQTLIHTRGASGDTLLNGVQQVHENKRVLYYYNPSNVARSTDQRVELPVRERNFYGWWRWYNLTEGKEDHDIPADQWETPPTNIGKFNFPYRIIGDSVWKDDKDHSQGKKLVTMGRYTVFHYPSKPYDRNDPPAKSPMVYPPTGKQKVTYAVDLSNYYDNLPLSMKNVNQVDTAMLDTMKNIMEPTLSLREVFELHPWTEMADTLEGYKDTIASEHRNLRYMEDHVVMAPTGNRLLLSTEQRYSYDNLKKGKHSESLLGYYMKDDNWATWDGDTERQDSMIWCGGWDADCKWYIYNPSTKAYAECSYPITEDDDFLQIPAKANITAGKDADTVYYCLRAQSKKTLADKAGNDSTVDGLYMFNICRYTVIYHRPEKYGPKLENNGKALITNDEIEQSYDVLERLNFDYNKPGSDYHVYPHPLPWGDASYGFTYPLDLNIIHNRYHAQEDFPNMGEYGLVNRIPYSEYWYKMEQHGGAENGYMIYCDGMSSSGQVAALSLETHLCEGQKMYFSGFVGNPSNQGNKAKPNFLVSVQGSLNGTQWEDISSYMTGDIPTSDKWYQIFFPIEQDKAYDHFRVRVYNMSSNNDGNDFVIDDMCIFATKPPLMVYQANTTCKAMDDRDSLTHIALRLDYQGFSNDIYEGGGRITSEYYTVEEVTKAGVRSFLKLEDGYYNEATAKAVLPSTVDTIYGRIPLPGRYYHPQHSDSVFPNLQELVNTFERTLNVHEAHLKDPSKPDTAVFRAGYVYEHLDDSIRPILYIIHSAKMSGDNTYTVHMASAKRSLMSSDCALTRSLKVRNRIMLALNGEEQPENEVTAMCANSTYDVSLHVKGTLLLDSVAPVEVTGTCYNDWLLYGDTAEASSQARYKYKYSDIVKVVRDILRADNERGENKNQLARNFAEVNRNEMKKVQRDRNITLSVSTHPYTILSWLVHKGFLTLYQSSLTITTPKDSTVKYTIFPIPGSGSQVMQDMNIEVCPTPIQIALTSSLGSGIPLIIGGLNRPESELSTPVTVLEDEIQANTEVAIPIDSLMMNPETDAPKVALKQIHFLSTDDPAFRDGIDNIVLVPDKTWSGGDYYKNGNDTLLLTLSPATNYRMRGGYNYTFGIEMMTTLGQSSSWTGEEGACPVGTITFTLGVVPDYLRWEPHDEEDSRWNNPDNWIGITPANEVIQPDAHFAPRSTTHVLIPPMTDGKPYPVLPKLDTLRYKDSIQQVGFQYNKCKSIRFLPGAALNQQQRLEYDSVIADLSAPNRKWALRSSPVEGLLSGDIYMANADLAGETSPWEVGAFDANGRNYNTGNATFWLSLYSRAVQQLRLNEKDSTITSAADWSAVTNGMRYHLKPAQGWAIYARTRSEKDAEVRLPKDDDVYYYYTTYGRILYDRYESNLRDERAKVKDPASPDPETVGKLAFYPGRLATSGSYTLTNETESKTFVFGNPTMGYIDIWGFIADNTKLKKEFRYIKADGLWSDVTEGSLVGNKDTIVSLVRYLPPMHAIELKLKDSEVATKSLTVTLNTNRIVTDTAHVVRPLPVDPAPAPMRQSSTTDHQLPIKKGIMTVTAVNPASPRCTSRLLLGQGFNEAVLSGEDAVLTTVNINNFSMTSAPATPFNIYAVEGNSGLSIDLRDEIVNVPISFYNSDLPFEPNSYLWFTGVNNIDGDLVLYDALLDIERPILDGICLEIETPETSHIKRYYIRRPGYVPGQNEENPIATGFTNLDGKTTSAVKFIRNGHVFILRDGHIYSIYGQKIR